MDIKDKIKEIKLSKNLTNADYARGWFDAFNEVSNILEQEEQSKEKAINELVLHGESVLATTPPGSIITLNDSPIYLGNRCIICYSPVGIDEGMICSHCKDAILYARELKNKDIE